MSSTAPPLRLEMLAQPRLLAAARALVTGFAARLGFGDLEAGQIALAVDEALCNVINHGYGRDESGRIWLTLWADDGPPPTIRIVIEDEGRQVDPATIRSRDLADIRPGGLGVHLIREIMDEARYERRGTGGMRLTLARTRRGCPTGKPSSASAPAPASNAQGDATHEQPTGN